ncbi:MAG TPA: hypothetical protein VK566_05055 [Nitrososphaeraceae archaeon]|jgi:ElaB/YqjD/DUF883 family membrane-anchored ribosome-binding protein|nr:hypothetical protein [Nitrososphaeraceae archaeon]
MSEFAFFRFKSANMLSEDEERDKQEMISLTEQVLDARGIECDARIAKISEDRLREILEEVRKLRRKKKMNMVRSDDGSSNEDRYIQNEEGSYIR